MRAKPYVGITGPVTIEETRNVSREFSQAGYSMQSTHIPMIGFLASYKTLSGLLVENRRYPQVSSLPQLLRATNKKVLPMIHYNSKEMNTLSDQITQLFEGLYDAGLCSALQLNIAWPDITQVMKIREQHPEMQIVFQASDKVMREQTPQQVAQGIKQYQDSIQYVLIDPSGGQGQPFDLESSINIYSEISNRCPKVTIGFAGGFTGENVAPRTRELIERIERNDFCIDAEGGLRDKITPAYGDDLLNINKVKEYLQSAASVLR